VVGLNGKPREPWKVLIGEALAQRSARRSTAETSRKQKRASKGQSLQHLELRFRRQSSGPLYVPLKSSPKPDQAAHLCRSLFRQELLKQGKKI